MIIIIWPLSLWSFLMTTGQTHAHKLTSAQLIQCIRMWMWMCFNFSAKWSSLNVLFRIYFVVLWYWVESSSKTARLFRYSLSFSVWNVIRSGGTEITMRHRHRHRRTHKQSSGKIESQPFKCYPSLFLHAYDTLCVLPLCERVRVCLTLSKICLICVCVCAE